MNNRRHFLHSSPNAPSLRLRSCTLNFVSSSPFILANNVLVISQPSTKALVFALHNLPAPAGKDESRTDFALGSEGRVYATREKKVCLSLDAPECDPHLLTRNTDLLTHVSVYSYLSKVWKHVTILIHQYPRIATYFDNLSC